MDATSSTALEDVVERIRKLLRLAHDAGATEHEAAVALERANRLLLRHNLELEQVAAHPGAAEPSGPIEETVRGGLDDWRSLLWHELAAHNLCTTLISRRYAPGTGWVREINLVGRPANVRATREMHGWITEQLERLAAAEWPRVRERDRGRNARTWKAGFFRGAVQMIATRLARQRAAQQAPEGTAPAAVTALVVRTDAENAAFIRQKYGDVKARERPRRGFFDYDLDAWSQGMNRAGSVGLAPDPRLEHRTPPALPD